MRYLTFETLPLKHITEKNVLNICLLDIKYNKNSPRNILAAMEINRNELL